MNAKRAPTGNPPAIADEAAKLLDPHDGDEALIYFFPNVYGTNQPVIQICPREPSASSRKDTAIRAIKAIMNNPDLKITLDDFFAP